MVAKASTRHAWPELNGNLFREGRRDLSRKDYSIKKVWQGVATAVALTHPASAYGVAILPPPDMYRTILTVRERSPLLQMPAPPHITLKSPFLLRQTGAMVVERLEKICEEWEPFEIRICGLGVFRNSILYARVEPSPDLRALHNRLVEELDGFVETLSDGRYDGTGFNPHLTLADRLTPTEVLEARRMLTDVRLSRRFLVERVHLLRGKGCWDIARSFPLGAA